LGFKFHFFMRRRERRLSLLFPAPAVHSSQRSLLAYAQHIPESQLKPLTGICGLLDFNCRAPESRWANYFVVFSGRAALAEAQISNLKVQKKLQRSKLQSSSPWVSAARKEPPGAHIQTCEAASWNLVLGSLELLLSFGAREPGASFEL